MLYDAATLRSNILKPIGARSKIFFLSESTEKALEEYGKFYRFQYIVRPRKITEFRHFWPNFSKIPELYDFFPDLIADIK
jgi:hypothetical protein